jgi:NhaP-type Na+/H+ or K+/H+ antiporter
LLLYGGLFSVALIVLRMALIFPGTYLYAWIGRCIFKQQTVIPHASAIFIVGWTGMRGVLSLAAALSLPLTLSDGRPFAQRNLILFLTYSVILVTLVLQGLSLPPLIRVLGLANNTAEKEEEAKSRRMVLLSGIASLEASLKSAKESEADDIRDLLHTYQRRLEGIPINGKLPGEDHLRRVALMRRTAAVEREALIRLREEGEIGDDVLRRLQRELDLTEIRHHSRYETD